MDSRERSDIPFRELQQTGLTRRWTEVVDDFTQLHATRV